MKYKKLLKKTVKRRVFEAKKSFKRGFKFMVFRNKYSRTARKYARMEVHRALKHGFRYIQTQIAIRPRIRLFSKVTLVLIISLFLTSKAAGYFKARESDIKVNGQAILVAKTNESTKTTDETILQASISSKRSPFDFRMPVESGVLSQGFSSYHRADDIAAAYGSPIYPLGSGKVEFAGFMPDGRGMTVVIDHGDGLKSLYAHMSKIDVGVSDVISETTVIGNIGLTGHTTGPHVHLEIYDNGVTTDPSSVLPDN
jgi:murein DD-endopeptidase MepM/ murein hydrolase activator NlpD